MSLVAGPFFAAALVLGVAGLAKLVRPDPTRVALRTAGLPASAAAARSLGAVEVAIAVHALLRGGRAGAALVALSYVGFAVFAAVLRRRSRGRASCGCFGSSSAPVTSLHVWVDAALAAVAVIAAVAAVDGIGTVSADTPLAGIAFLGLTALLAWLVQVSLTALPELQAAMHPPRRAVR